MDSATATTTAPPKSAPKSTSATASVSKPNFVVTDDVTPYRLIRIMNERFKDVRGYSEKQTQYGYSARKTGTFPSYQNKEGKWMVKAADATEYLKKYFERNLAPETKAS